MTSINTNTSAMAALASLQMTNTAMEETQNRISTGLRVGSASDNAAYWSIATTMRSDNKALSAVQDSLGIGAAQADVAYTALNATKDVLDEMKAKLVAAKQPGVDKGKIQEEITQLQGQLTSMAESAAFNGDNWLNVATGETANATRSIVSSFNRASDGTVDVATIDIDVSSAKLRDVDAGTGILMTVASVDLDGAGAGTAADYSILGSAGTATSTAIDITDADTTAIDSFITMVETGLSAVTTAASDIGSAKSRIGLQQNFTSALMDSLDRGIGTLVDADMTEESTRLKALQTQQQLGVQALSIANSSTQSLLQLFR